jgi:4-carboxymuconolactone decarboxylase
VLDAKDLGIGRRSFEPGARTAWHSHDKGQLLFVEQGRARVQRKGQPVKELAAGDSDYTAPNVQHWHGATPDQRLVQLNISFGGETKWMQKVTDEEYAGKR